MTVILSKPVQHGPGITVENDYYTVDSDDWTQARGNSCRGLQDLLDEFLEGSVMNWTHDIAEFVGGRQPEDMDSDDRVEDYRSYWTGNSENSLTNELSIVTYTDREFGPVALVAFDPRATGDYNPIAYTSVGDDSYEWTEWDSVDLICLANDEHSYSVRDRELTDAGGSYHSRREVFPDDIVTQIGDTAYPEHEGDREGDSVVLCPTCNSEMEVHMM